MWPAKNKTGFTYGIETRVCETSATTTRIHVDRVRY